MNTTTTTTDTLSSTPARAHEDLAALVRATLAAEVAPWDVLLALGVSLDGHVHGAEFETETRYILGRIAALCVGEIVVSFEPKNAATRRALRGAIADARDVDGPQQAAMLLQTAINMSIERAEPAPEMTQFWPEIETAAREVSALIGPALSARLCDDLRALMPAQPVVAPPVGITPAQVAMVVAQISAVWGPNAFDYDQPHLGIGLVAVAEARAAFVRAGDPWALIDALSAFVRDLAVFVDPTVDLSAAESWIERLRSGELTVEDASNEQATLAASELARDVDPVQVCMAEVLWCASFMEQPFDGPLAAAVFKIATTLAAHPVVGIEGERLGAVGDLLEVFRGLGCQRAA